MQTSDGRRVDIRPLRNDDSQRELAFLGSLSETTRYYRLFAVNPQIPPELLHLLMDVDYDRRMAFVATVGAGAGQRIVGVARYSFAVGATDPEFGTVTADGWQRRGIATRLFNVLADYARGRGIRRLVGSVLPDNAHMLAFVRSRGLTITYQQAEHLMQVSCDLTVRPVVLASETAASVRPACFAPGNYPTDSREIAT